MGLVNAGRGIARPALPRRRVGRAFGPAIAGLAKRTEDLQLENESLRQRLALFESVLATHDEGVLIAGLDSRYVYANRAAHGIFGYPDGALHGQRSEDLVPAELHPLIAEHREHRKHGQSSTYEVPLRDSQGRLRLLRIRGFPHVPNGQRQGSFSFITDITEQRALEHAAQDSEQRYRRLVENAPVGVYIGCQGKVAYCNPELARLLGASSPEEVIGLSVLRFVHAGDRAVAQARIAAYDDGLETETRRFEQRIVCLDGREMISDVIVTPFNHDDRPAVQVVIRDITRAKLAEEELRASEHRFKDLTLTLASKNSELKALAELRDVLVRMIVHDIRSPLTAMMLVLDGTADSGELRIDSTEATIAKQQLAYSVELCNQLLDIQRLQERSLPLNLECRDLRGTALRALAPLEPFAARYGVELQNEVAALEWNSDHRLLMRILTNLIGNAIKHSPRGAAVKLQSALSGDSLVLRVTDQGSGVELEDQPRIFELFATAGDHSKRGHGIGLAFCKLAVESLGGTIELHSEPRHGCEFVIRLPVLP